MKKNTTERRLFRYALSNKKTINIGLVCLLIAVVLELAGPLIAARIIDHHILGIEATWYEVEGETDKTVDYEGKTYVRSDEIQTKEDAVGEATILQIGRHFYFTDAVLPLDGSRSFENGMITVDSPGGIEEAEGTRLSASELYEFFSPQFQPIIILLIIYAALLFIAAIFQFWKTFLLQQASNKIVRTMRNDIFAHTQRVPINYYVDRPAGTIVARITNDTEAIRDLYERVLATFVTSFVYMAGIFVAMFFLNARLAAICLLVIPIFWAWMKVYKYFGTKYNKVVRKTVSEINGSINESIQGMPIIQAFNREKETKAEFEVLNTRNFTYQRKLMKLSALTSHNLVTVLRNLAFVAFIWYFGGAAVTGGSIVTVGVLYAFVDYLNRLFNPVTDAVNQLPLLEQARVAASRVFQLLDQPGEDVDSEAKREKNRGEIAFEHVSFAYNDKDYVLKDLSFEVKSGQTAAFVGHTGSGKSSIMNLLFRFYDHQKGKITIDGIDTKEMSRQQVRSSMGIVLQDPFLFTGTILTNVTMNNPDISREMAIQALQAVGAEQFISKLPKQYDEPVKEGGSTLSMGERQLVSFARALAFNPSILILDEATANIDTETEAIIQRALEVLKQGRTTLVIAHRLSTIMHADQIFVLDHGKILEQGNHMSLLEKQGQYYQMYLMQQSGIKRSAG
ncbi:ABC transporter ATP-binding protein [Terribacillus saccharophilus]|uniref:ABC transporter ATP-binding protein n=1 Tax=Terribacillus saccharophilus TaxID=361277 RepID=UPI003D299409